MKDTYLEVTYRHGRPIAAYYYLPRRAGDATATTRRVQCGMLVDFTKDGRAIGIEITAPALMSLAALNAVLRGLGLAPVRKADLRPLLAA